MQLTKFCVLYELLRAHLVIIVKEEHLDHLVVVEPVERPLGAGLDHRLRRDGAVVKGGVELDLQRTSFIFKHSLTSDV